MHGSFLARKVRMGSSVRVTPFKECQLPEGSERGGKRVEPSFHGFF
jgi:hypothetical protein